FIIRGLFQTDHLLEWCEYDRPVDLTHHHVPLALDQCFHGCNTGAAGEQTVGHCGMTSALHMPKHAHACVIVRETFLHLARHLIGSPFLIAFRHDHDHG